MLLFPRATEIFNDQEIEVNPICVIILDLRADGEKK